MGKKEAGDNDHTDRVSRSLNEDLPTSHFETMKVVVEVEQNKLAYKDMNDSYYYMATLILYGVSVLGSCVIVNIKPIFEFISVICVDCLAFVFPSVFYLIARRIFSRQRILRKHTDEYNDDCYL